MTGRARRGLFLFSYTTGCGWQELAFMMDSQWPYICQASHSSWHVWPLSHIKIFCRFYILYWKTGCCCGINCYLVCFRVMYNPLRGHRPRVLVFLNPRKFNFRLKRTNFSFSPQMAAALMPNGKQNLPWGLTCRLTGRAPAPLSHGPNSTRSVNLSEFQSAWIN